MRVALLTLAITVALCLSPTYAEANSGTPLMWATFLHLVLGNLVIGVGEGLLLGFLFRLNKAKATLVMLAANYTSCLAGMYSIPWLTSVLQSQFRPEQLLYSVPAYLALLAVALFALTLLVEWPFCFALLFRRAHRMPLSLAATSVAQCASYGVLLYFYWGASATSLYRLDVTPDFVPSLPPSAAVFFISPEGDVCRISLNGTGLVKAEGLQGDELESNLHARLDPQRGEYKIIVASRRGDRDASLAALKSDEWAFDDAEEQMPSEYASEAHSVADLRPADSRRRKFSTEFWAYQGLLTRCEEDQVATRVALEVPTIAWRARRATVLPGDVVVYQLGEQIVVLDWHRRKLGLLALGRSPVVAAWIGGSP